MKIPDKLYKYQPYTTYSLANLKNNHIYFNSPTSFNDPYDCLHSLDFRKLSDELVEDININGTKDHNLRVLIEKLFKNEITESELVEFYKLAFKDRKDSDKILKRVLGITPERYFEDLQTIFQENDQFEVLKKNAHEALTLMANNSVQKGIEDLRMEMARKHGVSCFSEVYDNMLMWSYYADGHQGFCLEFDTSEEPFNRPHKVEYVDAIPYFDPSYLLDESENYAQIITPFLAIKYKKWSHEREWRVIHKEASKLFCYKSKALTGIYLGSKIDPTNKEILLVILRGQNPDVKFYQMEKVSRKFRVVAKEISYATHLEGQIIFLLYLKRKFGTKKITMDQILSGNELNISSTLIEVYLDNLVHNNTLEFKDSHFCLSDTG